MHGDYRLLLSRWRYYLSSIPTLLFGIENWPRMIAAFLGLPPAQPFVIALRNGCRFKVRTRMDIWIIKEICLDRQYEKASLEIGNNWTIIDIGAGLGDFAIHVAKEHPSATIYAYEPFPQSFALLQENLRLNQVENVRAFPYALCAHTGPARFHIASEAVAHSTAAPQNGMSGECIEVPGITLDQLFAALQLSKCDYLKMDCEGAEYEILFQTKPETLQRIRHLCLEYHEGTSGFSHQDLVRFLTNRGFQVVKITPCPAHRHLGLLYAQNPYWLTSGPTPSPQSAD
ncbi:MAG: FkbM family methyltransferase [Chloroflexi bacterium]|nr:FkbM family methyltransferase [Chloroflexota bacterium]